MSVTRPLLLPRLVAALGVTALFAAGTAACQSEDGQAPGDGGQLALAVDELLAWDAVTAEATLEATPEEVYDYLVRSREAGGEARSDGGTSQAPRAWGRPSMGDAQRLAELDLTTSLGRRDGEDVPLREMESPEEFDSAMVVSFGGNDAAGLKNIDGVVYTRVDVATIVQDVRHGDAAAVAAAERFTENAARLPGTLAVPAEALQGDWVRADPFRYEEFASVLSERGAGTGIPSGTAEDVAAALTDAGELLTTEAQWAFVEELQAVVGSGEATLRRTGEERGADRFEVRLPAGEAWRAMSPLLTLFTEQSERFGLPPVVAEPTDEAAGTTVSGELTIRNGVLTGVTFDLAQFGPDGAGGGGDLPPLPLSVALTGGSALSLSAPAIGGDLTPEDLRLALMYLADQAERREEDPGSAEIPGPMQPGS
jgi:hypothetical protein